MPRKDADSKSSHRSAGMRYSVETQQEDRSLIQVEDVLDGWPIDRFKRDLGEDLVVRICEGGNPTGLSFYVQVKSVAVIEEHLLKTKPEEIHYPIDVSHLLQWERTTPPVVIFIWDVSIRAGWWNDTADVIRRLDEGNPEWRDQTTVTVTVPVQNVIDSGNRTALRARVAELVTAGRGVTIHASYSFPNTDEGRAALDGLKRALEHGDAHRVEGRYIERFDVSEPAKWAMVPGDGTAVPAWVSVQSSPSGELFTFSIEATSPDRFERVNLVMARVKGGSHSTTLSNEGQPGLLHVQLTLFHPPEVPRTIRMELSYEFPGNRIEESLELARFLLTAKQAGRIQLLGPSGGVLIANHPWKGNDQFTVEALRAWEWSLTRLNFIQSRVSSFGVFQVASLKEADLDIIESVHRVLSTGRSEGTVTFTTRLAPLPPEATRADLTMGASGANWDLLGVKIPQGRVKMEFSDSQFWDAMKSVTEDTLEQEVEFRDLPVKVTYLDWDPTAPGLAQHTAQ